jgi:serine protease Do
VQIQTIGGLEVIEGQLANQAPTSGIVVSADGFILSSAINFAQQPASILVRLHDGQQYPARIVAKDQLRMLVLLKIDADRELSVPSILPREKVRVGQWALAVGRSLEIEELNVSVGIVSALNRIWGRAIQTDAKVSPLNYGGPLIDIQGRVMGILVPLSPDSDSVAAGAEWYDSGIGFAVPLSDLLPEQLSRMQGGDDLKPGLLGIHLKGQNIYTSPAVIGFCPPKTPARDAGMATGDEIIQADDMPISRQVHLRHAMGRKMAGDKVSLRVRRGSEELSFSVTLTDKIEPYELPFLGILLSPASPDGTAVVAFVYPDSPAATAGVEVGDRLLALDQQALAGIDSWREAVAQRQPGQTVALAWDRGDEELTREVKLSFSPQQVPVEVPVRRPAKDADQMREEGRWTETRLADEPNECLLWEPAGDRRNNGLIMWLLPAGKIDRSALGKTWQKNCNDRGFLLALPRPSSEMAWEFAEIETIRKLLESITAEYRIDPHRVVIGGYQEGGSLAAAYAFTNRERIRGVALVDAMMPPRIQPRGNDPESRLEFLQVRYSTSRAAKAMLRDVDRLRDMRFPLIELEREGEVAPPDPGLAELMLRWADTLDRL